MQHLEALITATAGGVVEQSGFTAGNGNFVKVNTTELFDTIPAHV
jgi:hypothetical protein